MPFTAHYMKFLSMFLLVLLAGANAHSEAAVKSASKKKTFSSEQLAMHLSDALTREFPNEQGAFRVSLLRLQAPTNIPEGPIEVSLKGLATTTLRSRVMLKYELKVNGQLIKSESVPTEIQVMKEVLVSTRRLNRGEALSYDDLSLEIKDVMGLHQPPMDPASDISSYEINYTLMQGKILTKRNIRKKPVVDRGDIVNGWLKRGLLQINLKVEVMEEAAPGQLVRVKNIRTKKYMRGVVQDENSIIIP